MIPFFFFALGAVVASFIGVVTVRLYTGQGFVRGRSRCDACNTILSHISLVPIISYFISGGRANCCGARISVLSPITELLLGFLFVLSYLNLGLTLPLAPFLLSVSLLLALVLYDLAHQILPPVLLYTFVVTSALAGFIFQPSSEFISILYVAMGIGGFLALIHFLSRGRAMGFADAPFAFGLALLVGPYAFTGFIFSFWIGAVVGIALLLTRPVGSRMGVEVPFAPYLAAGFLLAYFTQWNPFLFIAVLS